WPFLRLTFRRNRGCKTARSHFPSDHFIGEGNAARHTSVRGCLIVVGDVVDSGATHRPGRRTRESRRRISEDRAVGEASARHGRVRHPTGKGRPGKRIWRRERGTVDPSFGTHHFRI